MKLELRSLKTVRMHRDRPADRQSQRETILFIDIDYIYVQGENVQEQNIFSRLVLVSK